MSEAKKDHTPTAVNHDYDFRNTVAQPGVADDDPHYLAKHIAAYYYAKDHKFTLRFYQSEFYLWSNVCHSPVVDLEATIMRHINKVIDYDHKNDIDNISKAGKPGDDMKETTKPKATASLLNSVMANLRAICQLTTPAGFDSPPFWIGNVSAVPPNEIFAAKNVLVHVIEYIKSPDQYAIMPHTPDFFNVSVADFGVSARAALPGRWSGSLGQMFPADDESVALLQEWFGYVLLPDIRYQKALMFYGKPRAGKGTILAVMKALVGPSSYHPIQMKILEGNFPFQSLPGKLVAAIEDADPNPEKSSEFVATIKTLTGSHDAEHDVNGKGIKATKRKIFARIVIATNGIMSFKDESGAFASRWCMLRFDHSFSGREDVNLSAGLIASDMPGIFNWAVEGLKRLRANNKFTFPESAKAAVKLMADTGNPIGEFLADCCILTRDGITPKKRLYDEFVRWQKNTGNNHTWNSNNFARKLNASCVVITDKKATVNSLRVNCYAGVEIKPFDHVDDADEAPHEHHQRRLEELETARPADASAGYAESRPILSRDLEL